MAPSAAAPAVRPTVSGLSDAATARTALPTPPKLSLIWPPCCSSTISGFWPPARLVTTSVNCAGSVRMAAAVARALCWPATPIWPMLLAAAALACGTLPWSRPSLMR